MWRELRSKKEPVCGDRIVHGSGGGVSFDELSACVSEECERKKARLQYRRFMVEEGGARLARG